VSHWGPSTASLGLPLTDLLIPTHSAGTTSGEIYTTCEEFWGLYPHTENSVNPNILSFVTSIFTKVLIADVLNLLSQLCDEDVRLSSPCLHSLLFYFNNQFYEQVDGVSMGSPLNRSDYKPVCWVWHVSDTIIVWPHGTEKLDTFLNHLKKHIYQHTIHHGNWAG